MSGLLDQQERAAAAGKGALDEQQVALGVRPDHAKLLDRRPVGAEVARHAEPLVDATWRGAGPDRARLAVVVGPVRLGAAREVVALHRAGEALALRHARDVDQLARREQVTERDRLAELEPVDVVDPELADRRDLRQIATELAGLRLRQPAAGLDAELDGRVTVA